MTDGLVLCITASVQPAPFSCFTNKLLTVLDGKLC